MYSEQDKERLCNYICQQIALGRSLVSICKEPDMPHYSTVLQWRNENATFSDKYARAREDQADYYADQIVEIADTEDDPNKARIRVDARKWTAGKLRPKVYGDRTTHAGDPEAPLKTESTVHLGLDEFTRRIVGINARTGENGGDQQVDA